MFLTQKIINYPTVIINIIVFFFVFFRRFRIGGKHNNMKKRAETRYDFYKINDRFIHNNNTFSSYFRLVVVTGRG